jgi:hypothetical protein
MQGLRVAVIPHSDKLCPTHCFISHWVPSLLQLEMGEKRTGVWANDHCRKAQPGPGAQAKAKKKERNVPGLECSLEDNDDALQNLSHPR